MKNELRKVLVREMYIDPFCGYFHQWGTYSNGEFAVTCGIVEDLKGLIHRADVCDIRFIDEFPKPKN